MMTISCFVLCEFSNLGKVAGRGNTDCDPSAVRDRFIINPMAEHEKVHVNRAHIFTAAAASNKINANTYIIRVFFYLQ